MSIIYKIDYYNKQIGSWLCYYHETAMKLKLFYYTFNDILVYNFLTVIMRTKSHITY